MGGPAAVSSGRSGRSGLSKRSWSLPCGPSPRPLLRRRRLPPAVATFTLAVGLAVVAVGAGRRARRAGSFRCGRRGRELADLHLAGADQFDLPVGEWLAIGAEHDLGLWPPAGLGPIGARLWRIRRYHAVAIGCGICHRSSFDRGRLCASSGRGRWTTPGASAAGPEPPVVSRILSISVAFAARAVVLMPNAWAIASSCSLSLDSSIDCSRASAATGHLLSEERQWARRVGMQHDRRPHHRDDSPFRTPARSFRPERLQRDVREPERLHCSELARDPQRTPSISRCATLRSHSRPMPGSCAGRGTRATGARARSPGRDWRPQSPEWTSATSPNRGNRPMRRPTCSR